MTTEPQIDSVATALAKMREPFPPNQISKLPKPYKKDSPKGKCGECGGFHGLPAVHLDYVGHAALTDRLLDADPKWTWDPATPDGLPALDRNNGMWIKLTIAGVSRLGYGSADGKSGGDAVKEVIGDALRNAAMRFGAALDLWHKGDLHVDTDAEPEQRREPEQRDTQPDRGQATSPSMTAWVEKQIAWLEGCKGAKDADRYTEWREDAEYKDLKAKVKKADQALWKRLHDAELAAGQRADDVPF